MADSKKKEKTIELWDGYIVTVKEELTDNYDFMVEAQEAINNNDFPTMTSMYMAIIGGEKVYKDVRKHIEDEHGYFSMEAFREILQKVEDTFPKAGNRAQRRSW